MPDKKSHIEESLRRAFEGFELPPKGEDWEAIEENMQPGNLDEQDSPLRDAFTGHTEDPLESDWLVIAAALDNEDSRPPAVSAPQHMENSLRGAFDDFTMPVSGRDWRIIASRLQLDGAYNFLNWRIVLPLLLLVGVLGIGSYALWNDSNNPRKAIAEISHQKKLNRPDAIPADIQNDALAGKNEGGPGTTAPVATAGNANAITRNSSAGNGNTEVVKTESPGTSDPRPIFPRNGASAGKGSGEGSEGHEGANTGGSGTYPGKGPGHGEPGSGSASGNAGSGTAGNTGDPGNGNVTVVHPDGRIEQDVHWPDFSKMRGTGLKTTVPIIPTDIEVFNPSALATIPARNIKVQPPVEAIPAFKREVYAAVQLNRDPGYMTGTITPGVQRTPGVLSGNAPSINLRMETGLAIKMNNWRFSGGLGLEQTLASQGTYKIRIPGDFLPYLNTHGDTLYLFPRSWRDSVIHVNNGPSGTWIEIPFVIERSFSISHNMRLRMGLSLNPGLMAAAGGQLANPFMSEDSTKWQYIAHRTVSNDMLVNASDMLNKYRIGSGLHIGLSKETARYDWGIQLQGRYYFNNAYKPGVPATQHNKSYGVQLKFAFKI